MECGKKKKLSIIMNGEEEDKFAWSGVNYFIINSLKKHFEVKYFKATAHYSFLSRLLIKIDKFFHKNAKEYPNIVNFLLYRKCIKEAKKYSPLLLTTISTYAAYAKNCFYVIDAVYKSLLNYYYFNVDKTDSNRLNSLQRKALAHSKISIFASDWSLSEAQKYYTINKNKSKIVLMGANLDDTVSYPKDISDKKEIKFLFMGADYERKGLDNVVSVIDYLNKNDTSHKYLLNVVGKKAENTSTIKYHGFLKKDNARDFEKYIELYRESDFFISLPKAECFGIVFCESSMFYLPSLSINTGGVSSYIKNNENGLLFQESDRIESICKKIFNLIYNPEAYKEMSKKSRQLYERDYNWNMWAQRVSAIINDCNVK